jgi:hypothetical protein
VALEGPPGSQASAELAPELVSLFHRLNNQLGVILANSELLESKLTEEGHRVRAAQVVTGALEAIGIVQHLKHAVGTPPRERSTSGR